MTSRSDARSDRAAADAGFSLAEMLVVLGILALTATLAVPSLRNPFGANAIATTAKESAALLRAARAEAIATAAETTVWFDVENRRVGAEWSPATIAIPPAATVTLRTARDETVADRIGRYRFFPDGSATGGRIAFRTADEEQTIGIDWLTGKITRTGGKR